MVVFLTFILLTLYPFISRADNFLFKVESGLSSLYGYENLFKDYPVYFLEKSVYLSTSISILKDFSSCYFEGGIEFLGASSSLYFYSGDVKEYQLTGGYLFAGGGLKKDFRNLTFRGGMEFFLKFYESFSVGGSEFSTEFLTDFFPSVAFAVDTFLTKRLFLTAGFKRSIGDVLSAQIAKGSWSSFNLGVGLKL